MSHIAITMLPGRSKETKKLLAERIRELLSKELYINEEMITVSIEDVPIENWNNSLDRISPDTMYI